MIFAAVGTQLPFDRLVKALDSWQGAAESEILVQSGSGGSYNPENIKCVSSVSITEFTHLCSEAELIVAHAGMGVILNAREYGKPLIIMPRRAELKEHRNDHQVATARHFGEIAGIYVANTAEELHLLLDSRDKLQGKRDIKGADRSLIQRIIGFIEGEK